MIQCEYWRIHLIVSSVPGWGITENIFPCSSLNGCCRTVRAAGCTLLPLSPFLSSCTATALVSASYDVGSNHCIYFILAWLSSISTLCSTASSSKSSLGISSSSICHSCTFLGACLNSFSLSMTISHFPPTSHPKPGSLDN